MFNRGKFNNGKFNTTASTSQTSRAFLISEMSGRVVASLKLRTESRGSMTMESSAKATNHTKVSAEIMTSELVVEKAACTKIYKCKADGDMSMAGNVTGANTFGVASLKLVGLGLEPGQELVINTDVMTVEINSQNRIMKLTSDSEFFQLKPGENLIQYADGNSTRKVLIKTLWKDRWL